LGDKTHLRNQKERDLETKKKTREKEGKTKWKTTHWVL